MRFCVYIACAVCAAILLVCPFAGADTAAARPSVAVMPFDVLGDASRAWIGKAIQEGLAGNFQQAGMQTSDNATGADFVITGSVQVVNDQMRISGKITNAAGDKLVGRFHSDGSVRDLFDIEDALASKVNRMIKPAGTSSAPAAAIQPVGPTLPSTTSHYFDGNIAATLAVPEQFQDQYNLANYHPTQWYWGYGYPYCYGTPYLGAWPFCVGRYGISVQANLSTW
jgi:TolB-like protein